MPETSGSRLVHIAAPDDMLVRALNQHAGGWRAVILADPPEPGALVIVDRDELADRQGAVDVLRGGGFGGPVVILGNREMAVGSADEPVERPVRLGVLLTRIEAHWAEADTAGVHRLGPYDFIPAEQLLRDTASDTTVRLTELECRLLNYLAAANGNGASVDREQLLAHVWGYNASVDTHTVETHIWRLRQKIETEDPATHFLVTEAGKYRLSLAGPDRTG